MSQRADEGIRPYLDGGFQVSPKEVGFRAFPKRQTAFHTPTKTMAFSIPAKGQYPSTSPEKTSGLPHSHKRRWLSASPENGCPSASLQKAHDLPHLPHPRRGRCPHRPAAPAPADLQASGSEKRSRGNATTTPTRPAPSATGRRFQKLQKSIACPKAGQNRRLHRYADSRQRGGPLHRSASKRPFLLDRAIAQPLAALPLTDAAYPLRVRPVSLLARPKEKWGVHCPAGNPADFPGG